MLEGRLAMKSTIVSELDNSAIVEKVIETDNSENGIFYREEKMNPVKTSFLSVITESYKSIDSDELRAGIRRLVKEVIRKHKSELKFNGGARGQL